MNESETLLKLVQEHLDEFCSTQRQDFAAISGDLAPLVDYTQSLLEGGGNANHGFGRACTLLA